MDRLDTWTIFTAVAEQSSFTKAARRLGLVPAPASDTSYLDLGH